MVLSCARVQNAREELVALNAQLLAVEAEKAALEETSAQEKAALQAKLDSALGDAQKSEEALHEALATIEELRSEKAAEAAKLRRKRDVLKGAVASAAQAVVSAARSVRSRVSTGVSAAKAAMPVRRVVVPTTKAATSAATVESAATVDWRRITTDTTPEWKLDLVKGSIKRF